MRKHSFFLTFYPIFAFRKSNVSMKLLRKILGIVLHIDNFFVSVLTVAVLCVLFTVIKRLDFLDPVEKVLDLSMMDVYYQINNIGEKSRSQQISIVDITDLTARQRDSMAIVVSQIAEMEPAVLGVDIIFEYPSDNPQADFDLIEAFKAASQQIPIVMADKLSSHDWSSNDYTYITRSFFSDMVGLEEGSVNITGNPSTSLSTYPVYLTIGSDTVCSLPAKMVEKMTGDKVVPNRRNEYTINYDAVSFDVINYRDLPNSRHLIEGRYVLLGAYREESDKHFTPIGEIPGIEIIAHTINTMTYGSHVWYGNTLWVVIFAIIAGYLMNAFEYFMSWFINVRVPRLFKSRRLLFLEFFTESEIYDKIIAFIFMIIFTGFTYWLYVRHAIYVNTWLALGTIAFIEEGRLIFKAWLVYLRKRGLTKPCEHSLYAKELLHSDEEKYEDEEE